jgi:hypothetical protein
MRIIILYAALLIYFLSSCSTDFDINAEKQDITVVYGLIDQNSTEQYVKVTHAFLGDTSAYIMAGDSGNSSYGNDLDVIVQEYNNSNLVRTFTLVKTLITDKIPGTFYYPNQWVYKFTVTPPALNTSYTYKLLITNKTNGKTVTASTSLIPDFSVQKPAYNPDNPQIGFVGPNGSYTISDAQWKSAKNARIYEITFRFHYREANKTTLDTVNKYVDWDLPDVRSEGLNGNEVLLTSYNGESFYKLIQANVPIDYNLDRITGMVDFIISAGADDLAIYIDLNRPSNTIIQERPSYTNINNGIGIFSSRYSKTLSFKLSSYSTLELINGQYTGQLGFK